MTQLRVLAVYGHPDDEGQVTGALARFVDHGARVTLICCTRGEVGEISDPVLSTPETLPYVRELELRASMAQIGFSDVRFLPYRDSGMPGTPENDDPLCLSQQPPSAVQEHLVHAIRELRPHYVFTWDPEGGYGHPDHIAAHRHTLAAFDAAANAEAYPSAGAPWTPERLYWSASRMKRFASVWLEMERRGLLPEPIAPDRRERLEKAMAEPDPPVSVVLDVRPWIPRKRAAASMHRTQFGENSLFARVPADFQERFYGEERFFEARPGAESSGPPATDFPPATQA